MSVDDRQLLFLLAGLSFLIYLVVAHIFRRQPKPEPTYEELLQKPRWFRVRNRQIREDGSHCRFCGETTTLQVHHAQYWRDASGRKLDPWHKYYQKNKLLVTMCADCHTGLTLWKRHNWRAS